MVSKHNDALRVLPVLFSEQGFQSTVCDPSYANYMEIPDLSIFADYPLILREVFYDDGYYNDLSARYSDLSYIQIKDGASRAKGLDIDFLNSYSVLESLEKITSFNSSQGEFLYLTNMATHSPMLLSDVPLWHDIILKRRGEGCDAYSVCCGIEGNKSDVGLTNTFAANIFDLYRCPFFMENGTMGAFAASKVNALLQKFRLPGEKDVRHIEPDELKDDLKLAMLIGDPFISRLIWRRLDALVEDDGDSNFGKELNQMRDGNEKN